MRQLSPVCKEILAIINKEAEPTVDTIENKTTRPRSLIEESLNRRLEGRYVSKEEGTLSLTDRGEKQAEQSQFIT